MLEQITDVLYRQRLHITQIKNGPFFISSLNLETFLSKDESYSLLLLTSFLSLIEAVYFGEPFI